MSGHLDNIRDLLSDLVVESKAEARAYDAKPELFALSNTTYAKNLQERVDARCNAESALLLAIEDALYPSAAPVEVSLAARESVSDEDVCEAVRGASIAYVALEGAPSSYRGETLHAAKDLFATFRDRRWPSIITDPPKPA